MIDPLQPTTAQEAAEVALALAAFVGGEIRETDRITTDGPRAYGLDPRHIIATIAQNSVNPASIPAVLPGQQPPPVPMPPIENPQIPLNTPPSLPVEITSNESIGSYIPPSSVLPPPPTPKRKMGKKEVDLTLETYKLLKSVNKHLASISNSLKEISSANHG